MKKVYYAHFGIKRCDQDKFNHVPKKAFLPPLHNTLGLIKHFVKASDTKFKEGIFVGPGIQKLLTENEFKTKM